MPDPRNKIAKGAMEVDKCPEKGCDYIITSSAAWVLHMWHVHKIMIPKEDRE